MKTQLALTGDAKTLDALSQHMGAMILEPIQDAKPPSKRFCLTLAIRCIKTSLPAEVRLSR